MLICKYTRLENASFVPHLDTLRAVTMAIRRCGIKADYSEGFNPHLKIFFGQPLPIGVESECEYFCVYAHSEPQEFVSKMNCSLPQGLKILNAAEVEKDPNVANLMSFADYTVTMRDTTLDLSAFEKFASGHECVISYEQKGETVTKDVKSLISFVKAEKGRLHLRLACGNKNLRADRLINFLCDKYAISCGFGVVKTRMYDCNGVDLDNILFGSGH